MASNRLWDAIDNGAIPVFTDHRQYDVLPFQTLWRRMSLRVHTNDTFSSDVMAKRLVSLSKDSKRRWSELMDAQTTGRPIVSWLHPRSVTLHAYVQLLVDKINGMFCGPCINTKERKETCRRPRCQRNKCVWSLIHENKGCGLNADGMVITWYPVSHKNTTQDCQAECEKADGCVGVDYNKIEKQCHLLRKACSRPLWQRFSSYRLDISPLSFYSYYS